MVKYDIFVHPGFPAEERKVRGSRVFQEYCDKLSTLAASAEQVIHVVDPKIGHHDAFLEDLIPANRRVRSYVLDIPLVSADSYGVVCRDDWDTFVGLLHGIRKHRDPVQIHGSLHGLCILEFAVQLYELVHNHKQYLPNPVSCFLNSPFPFRDEDTQAIAQHALDAHYFNSNIRFGTVFANSAFDDINNIRKSLVRQMTDKETKVYSL
ncbi:hypothetical protein HZC31_00310 [Candidatus Woesearchaeota archaeon]|nr:hypothetical protein [Candidatus Woesearchaeota archaeon]